MRSRRLTRRFALTLAGIAALAAGASPARTDRTVEDLGEVWTSPVRHRAWRTFCDPVTGEKWLESADGQRAESVAAVVAAEESALTDLERRVAPELVARMRDPAQADLPVVVIFRMARQPATEAADAASLRHDPRLERVSAEMRAILGRLEGRRAAGEPADPREEETLLTPSERDDLHRLRATLREVIRTKRREVIDAAKPAAFEDQEALAADLGRTNGARVVARPWVLSCVAARVPLGAVETLLAAHPEVAHAAPSIKCSAALDISVPVVGASTWWNAGYNGSSSTKIAILDTGVDSAHPALSSNVSDESVNLSAGSSDTDFADNASSTDDYHTHGTHVAGIAASGDSTYAGVAPGASLMNAKCGYLWQDKWGNTGGAFQDSDIMDAGDWAADNGADVFNCSFGGGGTTDGSNDLTLFFDAIVHDLGIAVAVGAGNSGSGSNTVGIPADGFNVVTVANWDEKGTTSLSDDGIASSSSRGPLDDGRRKPDLAAPGTTISSCDATWDTNGGQKWISFTGTSMSCPHVAGALALLTDYGAASYPEGLKALLLTNTLNTSPFPSTPGNTWGYGAMDLSATYTNRGSLCEGSLSSSGARYVLLDGSSLGSTKRVTLTWGRRVVSKNNAVPTSYSSQLDLDLYLYDDSDGTSRGSSRSSLDSVEQVSTSASVSGLVVKVYRASSSFPSGLSTQRFAVATESKSSLAVASGPSLASSFTALPTAIAGTTDFTVSVSVNNAGDLPAIAPSLTLTLPSGYSIVTGSNPVTLSTLAAGGSASGSWTVRSPATGSGSKTFSASATTTSYGETFAGTAKTASQTLDVAPPTSPSVTLAGGATYATSSTMTATLSASDSDTGVTSMRTRTAGDAWGAWVAYATSASVTLTGGDGARTLQAEFRDAVGNVSSTASDSITVDSVAPSGTVTAAGGAAWATTAAVTLTTAASDSTSGVSEMRFSSDGSSWTSWSSYGTSAGWTLPGQDGAKTVYAQFRDAAGNVSATASDEIGLDRVAPTGTLTIDAGNTWAASPAVTLGVTASDSTSGGVTMRFSDDGVSWSTWTTLAATASWTLPGADGTKTVHAQFRDAAGNVSSTVSDSIGLDRTLPSGTVVIASGAAWTGSREVTLTTSSLDGGSSVAEMRFSDDGTTWSAWAALSSSASWTLPAGDGTKTVHAQFRDIAGNLSPPVTDTIGLDQSGPTGSVTVAAGAAWTTSAGVTLTLAASDSLSGPASMRFSDDGTAWSAWTTYATSASFTFAGSDGTRTVHAQFRDAVGNVSATLTDTIGLDRAAPSGTLTAAGGAAWAAGADISLGVSVVDGTSGVTSMRFSDDGASWTAWTPHSPTSSWTLPGADGAKTVYAQFLDVAGNVSAVVSDAVGLDRGAPSATLSVAGGATWSASPAVTLTPSSGDATSGVFDMRFSDDGANWSSWSAIAATAPWTLPGGDGTKVVYLQVRDGAGNLSGAASDAIGLDTAAPAGSVVIENGTAATNHRPVGVVLSWADTTSGVVESRFSDDGANWSAWTPVSATASRNLPAGDGVHAVHVQFRDAAGNVSEGGADDILVDTIRPSGTIVLGDGTDYLAPGAVLTATLVASDTQGGSGVAEFRWSHDDAATWSGWVPFDAVVTVGLPEGARDIRRTVLGEFRDAAGNISSRVRSSIHVVSESPQDAQSAKTIRGRLGAGGDVDAYRVRLVAGDRLDARVALHASKGTKLSVGVDLYDDSGARVVAGRYPARGPSGRIRGFKAPATGTYVLVVHSLSGDATAEVPYDLTTTTRIGRATVAGSGVGVYEIPFDATEGRVLTGSLRGLSLASAVLQGPDGDPVGFTLRSGKGGSTYALPTQTLSFGSGHYVLRVAPADRGKVKWALHLALAHRAKTADEILAP